MTTYEERKAQLNNMINDFCAQITPLIESFYGGFRIRDIDEEFFIKLGDKINELLKFHSTLFCEQLKRKQEQLEALNRALTSPMGLNELSGLLKQKIESEKQ